MSTQPETSRAWIPRSLNGNGASEPSPLGAARVRRRLTVDEAAARAQLDADEVAALEEGRIYRFRSVQAAVSAALVYATSLGIDEREARRLAGLPVGRRPVEAWSLRRWTAALAFTAAALALVWFAVRPELSPRAESATGAVAAVVEPDLPQPWEIEVHVFNGTRRANAATGVANEIAGLAYRIGNVGNAKRADYRETRVYYPPGGEAIAARLARDLGVGTVALPSGKDPHRLVVIVGG
ncbi:MAG TPA: LytR C-terminal domain-containing protein [Gaiellaceae bacterium]|nr:LytR C-terminal domain-containing protein [Gaiellaceae bacterium]